MGLEVVPRNSDAEEAVIGSLLIDGQTMSQVAYSLKASDFYYEQNRWLYQACLTLFESHRAVDQITVAHELQGKGVLDKCGGAAQLSHLIAINPGPLDIEYYANIVRDLSARRSLIDLSGSLTAMARDLNSNHFMESLNGKVKDFIREHGSMSEFVSPKEAGNITFSLIEKYNNPVSHLSWGFRDLDSLTAGVFPGELNIIGARPRIGKTQLMIDTAQNSLDKGKKVLLASVEMTVEHILERRVARELGTSIKRLRMGGVDDQEMVQITELSGKIADSDLYFLRQGVSSSEIYEKALKMKETIGLDLIFIDYLQKLRDCYGEKENENVRIGRACQRVKDIAVDLNVPVICASQFNRNSEYRADENKVPVISDLRGSGSIEQDADVILLLWRDGPQAPVLNIRMAKSRQVEPGDDVKLVWVPGQRRYGDYVGES